VLLATGTLAAAATPAPAGAGGVARGVIIAQNAPSLTPTPQQGPTSRPRRSPTRPSTAPARPTTQLPYTGGKMWLVFLGGLGLLLSGIGLRVRAVRLRRIPR